jgi:hypothetical protein
MATGTLGLPNRPEGGRVGQPVTSRPVHPAELRQQAIELEADLWPDNAEDRRGAAELLAAFADYDRVLLPLALLGDVCRRRLRGARV